MTNKEYIESQNLSFSEGLKLWDKDKYSDFSEWLKALHRNRRFKVGDVLEYKPAGTNYRRSKYVVIGVDVKSGMTGRIYAYNTIVISPDGKIKFETNKDVESGDYDDSRAALIGDWCDDDPAFIKIA